MSTVKATTISNLAGDKTISTDRVAQGTAAAWVNFNGTGTVAIRASYNVSSITDNNIGDYTVNFTTSLTDANYALSVSATLMPGGTNVVAPCIGRYNNTVTAKAASNCIVSVYPTGSGAGTAADSPNIDVIAFR
jgi:predicted aconitase